MTLADIKARLEMATDEEWHKYQISVARPPTKFVVGPSAYRRLFNEGDAEFLVHSREDMALLLAVVAAELGHYSPAYRAEHWRIKAKIAATPEAEQMCNDNAKAWEAIA